MKPRYFKSPGDFRGWLDKHHKTARELLVGFHKRATGRPSLTWPESVDEALCFGWIDGIRRRIDAERYSIRFTPRRPDSIWSVVNTRRVAVLMREGRMHDAGIAVLRARDAQKTKRYSFERDAATLAPRFERRFRENVAAWSFFSRAAPSYRRLAAHWIMSAKQEAARERRFARLLGSAARGEKIDWMKPGQNANDRQR